MDSSPFVAASIPNFPITVHNVRLLSGADAGDGRSILQVEHEGRIHEVRGVSSWTDDWHAYLVGKVGYLARPMTPDNVDGALWFYPYLDQSLRRCPHFDCNGKFGWTCDRWAHVEAAPHVVPGLDGQVVRDETIPVTIPIPPEFAELASSYGLSPEQLLRAFVADAAEIQNLVAAPREDGFSSNGSDERDLATNYVERAFGHLREEAEQKAYQLEQLEREQEEREDRYYDVDSLLEDLKDHQVDAAALLAVLEPIARQHLVPDVPDGT